MINTVLKPFHPPRHGPLLARWLHAPHVARWWGDPTPQLATVLNPTPGGEHALIVVDTMPVGYLRWQRVEHDALVAIGLDAIPDGAVDVDILIGEEEYVGIGVGSQALRLLVDALIADPSIPMIGMTTSNANAAALRAYAKVGFRPLLDYTDPQYGRCRVLVIENSNFA